MTNLLALLGRDNLDKLSRAVGGTRLAVPTQFGKPRSGGRDTSKRLSAIAGPELAILLVFHFGGSRIYVPKARDAKPVDRRQLSRLARSDLSAHEVAKRLGGCCTERAVEKIRARERAKKSIIVTRRTT